jgi:hypothetical protein
MIKSFFFLIFLLTNKKLDYLLIRLANMALARKKKAFKKGRERVRKKKKLARALAYLKIVPFLFSP